MKKDQYEQELKASMLDLRNAWIRCLFQSEYDLYKVRRWFQNHG